MIVEIWSDVVCPWCYIGKRRFEAAVAAFIETNPGVEIDVHYRAFLLDPEAPVGVSEPVRQSYEKKFGGPAGADEVLTRVTREAAGEGLDFRMDVAQRSNTLLAHRLLVLAERNGCQLELKERLFSAYFTEGRSIGDLDTLIDLAADVGMDREDSRSWLEGVDGRDDVVTHLEFAADAGLTSVPTFVFDRRVVVPGAQQTEVFVEVLKQLEAQSST